MTTERDWTNRAINGKEPAQTSGESWWIGVSREDWPHAVEAHQPQLSSSKFGRAQMLVTPTRTLEPDAEQKYRQGRQQMVSDLERREVAR